MVKISVLVPVYNVEEYLEKSFSQIINQNFDDFEIIYVDDGSSDNSLSYLKDFQKRDSRVKIFSKENGGCGSARNYAFLKASGEYVYFLDPDDELEEDTLKKAYNSAVINNADIVIFKANTFNDSGVLNDVYFNLDNTLKQADYSNFNFTYNDILEFIFDDGFAPWSKLYKKEFLDSNNLRFDEGIAFDDVPFHVKTLIKANRLAYVNEILYHYRVDNESSVNNTASNGFDIFKVIDILHDFLITQGIYNNFEESFIRFEINHILAYIISTDSEKYFGIAQKRFKKISKEKISMNYEKYELVIASKNYTEFKSQYLDFELKRLKGIYENLQVNNKKIKTEIGDLKKENNQLLSSNSWKITKPLRKIKRICSNK